MRNDNEFAGTVFLSELLGELYQPPEPTKRELEAEAKSLRYSYLVRDIRAHIVENLDAEIRAGLPFKRTKTLLEHLDSLTKEIT